MPLLRYPDHSCVYYVCVALVRVGFLVFLRLARWCFVVLGDVVVGRMKCNTRKVPGVMENWIRGVRGGLLHGTSSDRFSEDFPGVMGLDALSPSASAAVCRVSSGSMDNSGIRGKVTFPAGKVLRSGVFRPTGLDCEISRWQGQLSPLFARKFQGQVGLSIFSK